MSAVGRCSGETAGLLRPMPLKSSPWSGHRPPQSPDHCLQKNLAWPRGPRSSGSSAGGRHRAQAPCLPTVTGHFLGVRPPQLVSEAPRGPERAGREVVPPGGGSRVPESPCTETGGRLEVAWGGGGGRQGGLVKGREGSRGPPEPTAACAQSGCRRPPGTLSPDGGTRGVSALGSHKASSPALGHGFGNVLVGLPPVRWARGRLGQGWELAGDPGHHLRPARQLPLGLCRSVSV